MFEHKHDIHNFRPFLCILSCLLSCVSFFPFFSVFQLSSCQIYNVEKRIQEDHLQQLALFSEYGRMALNREQAIADGIDESGEGEAADAGENDDSHPGDDLLNHGSLSFKGSVTGVTSAVRLAAKARANAQARREKAEAVAEGEVDGDNGGLKVAAGAPGVEAVGPEPGMPSASRDRVERPFQRLEFLVRDWQVRRNSLPPPPLAFLSPSFGVIGSDWIRVDVIGSDWIGVDVIGLEWCKRYSFVNILSVMVTLPLPWARLCRPLFHVCNS